VKRLLADARVVQQLLADPRRIPCDVDNLVLGDTGIIKLILHAITHKKNSVGDVVVGDSNNEKPGSKKPTAGEPTNKKPVVKKSGVTFHIPPGMTTCTLNMTYNH